MTVIRCGKDERLERALSSIEGKGAKLEYSSAEGLNEIKKGPLLFAVAMDELGQDACFTGLIRSIRSLGKGLSGCLAGVIVVGVTELDTKDAGRRLIFHLDRAGCAFPERPLVEATGSMRNLNILKKKLELDSLEEAFKTAAGALVGRMLDFISPRFENPRLLVLHASDHATSNTLSLGELVLESLDERFSVRTLSLRNGAIEDCRGCSYKVCSHFAAKGACFYGGSITEEVMPAVRECDALLLLLPNYNDSVGANVMAFINRLTSLHVNNTLSGRRLFAIVVSGYSGGDLVAEQAMGALCLNKSFLLPPDFCMLETANDPGEIMKQPGIRGRAEAFAKNMERELLT